MRKIYVLNMLFYLIFFKISPASAIIIDGFFDPLEGYTQGYFLDIILKGTSTPAGPQGQLWFHQDAATKDVSAAFIQPLELIDNSYGVNVVNWPKKHKFNHLLGSDKAQFVFTDNNGNILLDFYLDYLTKFQESGINKYKSLGATGGDGSVNQGSAAFINSFGTSLEYNINTLGHLFTVNSPATTPGTYNVIDPAVANWVFEVIYEVRIDGSLFDLVDFGDVNIPLVHDSPNKLGKNAVTIQRDGIIPEPSTFFLLGSGLLAAFIRRKK